jgi:putative methylase
VANPPFGAQSGNEGTDRAFLRTAATLADVSYSIHNAGSQAFVESFAADEGGEVTHAFAAEFEVPRLYEHHDHDRAEIEVEVFRIEWD